MTSVSRYATQKMTAEQFEDRILREGESFFASHYDVKTGGATTAEATKVWNDARDKLIDLKQDEAIQIVKKAMGIAADVCIYTNNNLVVETI